MPTRRRIVDRIDPHLPALIAVTNHFHADELRPRGLDPVEVLKDLFVVVDPIPMDLDLARLRYRRSSELAALGRGCGGGAHERHSCN